MRRWLVALCLLGSATHAVAGEFAVPTLRGSSPFIPAPATYTRWQGFYAGGQVGYAGATMDYKDATEELIAHVLRTTALENEQRPSQWGVLGTASNNGHSYGGFVGYNTQWQDAVLGIDLHYNRTNLFSNAPVSPITRVTSAGGNTYLVTVDGDASMRITDYGAIRARAGWAFRNFLPFGTLGFAVGRADVTRSARVNGVENPPAGYPGVACDPLARCTPFSFSANDGRTGAFVYGWSAGLGMDVMLMQSLFVRAEYEFIQFGALQGIGGRVQTGRVGAGVKF
jgi:outer membrane immunogenic protein